MFCLNIFWKIIFSWKQHSNLCLSWLAYTSKLSSYDEDSKPYYDICLCSIKGTCIKKSGGEDWRHKELIIKFHFRIPDCIFTFCSSSLFSEGTDWGKPKMIPPFFLFVFNLKICLRWMHTDQPIWVCFLVMRLGIIQKGRWHRNIVLSGVPVKCNKH